jgi:hypothetical protein
MKAGGSVTLASLLQQEGKIGRKQKMYVVWQLSVPAILAQITFILMEYIDTAMVGNLGAGASAAIGVVSTTTWLFGGLCSAVSSGFSVHVAERIGAGDTLIPSILNLLSIWGVRITLHTQATVSGYLYLGWKNKCKY